MYSEESSLLDQIVEQGRFGKETASRERGKDLVKEFVAQVLDGSMTVAKDAEMMINARIAQIDHLLSLQLNEIMHHAQFQKLEGSLARAEVPAGQQRNRRRLKIRVFNVTKKELLRDMQRAPEFDQSALFKKVYEEEYGVFGGAPFGALGRRLRVRQASGRHRHCWTRHVACRSPAHAPFLTAAAPDLMNLDSYTPTRRAARSGEDLRQQRVCQVEELPPERRFALRRRCRLPRTLGRLPYGAETKPFDGCFNYEESVDGTDHSQVSVENAAYALGTRLTPSCSLYGCVRGDARGGGRWLGGGAADT